MNETRKETMPMNLDLITIEEEDYHAYTLRVSRLLKKKYLVVHAHSSSHPHGEDGYVCVYQAILVSSKDVCLKLTSS